MVLLWFNVINHLPQWTIQLSRLVRKNCNFLVSSKPQLQTPSPVINIALGLHYLLFTIKKCSLSHMNGKSYFAQELSVPLVNIKRINLTKENAVSSGTVKEISHVCNCAKVTTENFSTLCLIHCNCNPPIVRKSRSRFILKHQNINFPTGSGCNNVYWILIFEFPEDSGLSNCLCLLPQQGSFFLLLGRSSTDILIMLTITEQDSAIFSCFGSALVSSLMLFHTQWQMTKKARFIGNKFRI